jgi:hypothetical protein
MTFALYHIFRRPAALKSPDEQQDDTPTKRVESHAIATPDPSVTRQRCRSMRLLRLDVVQRRPLALIEIIGQLVKAGLEGESQLTEVNLELT